MSSSATRRLSHRPDRTALQFNNIHPSEFKETSMGKQSKTKQQRRNAPVNPTTTDAPTAAAAWKKSKTRSALRLPSGNVALIRRVGPEAFMEQGIMPDMLAPIIQKAINDKRGLPPKALEKAMSNPDALGQLVEMMDRLAVYATIEPEIVMPPGCEVCGGLDNVANKSVHEDESTDGYHKFVEAARDEDTLYADEVDLNDKVFIMNFCVGGSSDLERFREEHREAMGGMDSQPGLEGASV
jgi:hypothetical protein